LAFVRYRAMVMIVPDTSEVRRDLPVCVYANFETARKLVGDVEAARMWARSDARWPDTLPIILREYQAAKPLS
jgi:hypothetical protein